MRSLKETNPVIIFNVFKIPVKLAVHFDTVIDIGPVKDIGIDDPIVSVCQLIIAIPPVKIWYDPNSARKMAESPRRKRWIAGPRSLAR
jgi:hypothetical protein